MQITNLIKLNVTKNVMSTLDVPKIVDVLDIFSQKQFDRYSDEFLSALQDFLIDVVKVINERKKT